MPQTPTAHPPLPTPDLPLDEQSLLRLDEIIGLLDRIATSWTGRVSPTINSTTSTAQPSVSTARPLPSVSRPLTCATSSTIFVRKFGADSPPDR